MRQTPRTLPAGTYRAYPSRVHAEREVARLLQHGIITSITVLYRHFGIWRNQIRECPFLVIYRGIAK